MVKIKFIHEKFARINGLSHPTSLNTINWGLFGHKYILKKNWENLGNGAGSYNLENIPKF